jgi:hypothetical protein
MIDRVVVSTDKKSATLIFDNRAPFMLSSDTMHGLIDLIYLFIGDQRAKQVEIDDIDSDKWPMPSDLEDTFKIVA